MGNVNFSSVDLNMLGHDIMSQGNMTAKSKYELVTNWSLLTTGDNLHSFVSICNYYSKFSLFFQLKDISLR